jgi:hypothetical protein
MGSSRGAGMGSYLKGPRRPVARVVVNNRVANGWAQVIHRPAGKLLVRPE